MTKTVTRTSNVASFSDVDSETDIVMNKKQFLISNEKNKAIVERYRSDVIKAKGELEINKQMVRGTEQLLEKQHNKITNLTHENESLKTELGVMKSKAPKSIKYEPIDVTDYDKKMDDEVNNYVKKHNNTDDHMKKLMEKYNIS